MCQCSSTSPNKFLSLPNGIHFPSLESAGELSRRAILSTQRADKAEAVADCETGSAIREALFGNGAEGRQLAKASLTVLKDENPAFLAALALAVSGDISGAQGIANHFAAHYPEDTIVQFIYLPTIRSRIALWRKDSPNTIDLLQTAGPYELGDKGGCGIPIALYPVCVRGEAFLAAHQGHESATEFQKIFDHAGVVLMSPIGALARLGMGRADALQGETSKARTAYQDYFNLWKNADPDVPVLVAAKRSTPNYISHRPAGRTGTPRHGQLPPNFRSAASANTRPKAPLWPQPNTSSPRPTFQSNYELTVATGAVPGI